MSEEVDKRSDAQSQVAQQLAVAPANIPRPLVGVGWVDAANRVFWCIVAFTIAGVLSVVFDVVALSSISSDWLLLFTNRKQLADEASALFAISIVIKVALGVCFCFYMLALERFEREQPTEEDAKAVSSMRMGVIMQFICFILVLVLPFMSAAAVVIVLLLYALLIVAYNLKRNGSKRLNHSESFTDQTRRGAEDLRFAAVCNINIILTPIVLLIVVAFIIWGAFGTMPRLTDVISVFALVIAKMKGIISLSSSEIGQRDGIMGVVLIAFAIAALLCLIWGIFALVYPIRGWNRIRTAPEPAKAQTAAKPENTDDATPTTAAPPEASAAPVSSVQAASSPSVSAAPASSTPEDPSAVAAPPAPALSATAKEETTAVSPTDEADSQSEEKTSSKKKYYIAGGVLLAALLAGGAYLLFGKSSLKVTDYAVSMSEDGEYTFYANTSGEAIPTDITTYGLSATILDQHDYDDDGNIEALVLVNEGGNAHEPYPFVIYYDQDTKTFKQTEEFEMPNGKIEEVNGRWTFIQRKGLRQTNYVFEDRQVKVTEESVHSVADADRKYLLSVMYRNDGEGDRTITYDLDDDGSEERLSVHRGYSHAEGNGEYMSLEEIQWKNGKTLKSVVARNDYPVWNYTIYGAEIAFLQSKTNGMHDILTDGIHYHRWNGSTYKEWIWDGTQLVCTDTSEGQYEAMTTWDGDYRFTGVINGQWHFDMWLNIDGAHVWGSYLVHESDNGYVALNGTIDTEGAIRIDEHYPDGRPTGYYFQGTFSSDRISGKYLSTQRSINFDFYAN